MGMKPTPVVFQHAGQRDENAAVAVPPQEIVKLDDGRELHILSWRPKCSRGHQIEVVLSAVVFVPVDDEVDPDADTPVMR